MVSSISSLCTSSQHQTLIKVCAITALVVGVFSLIAGAFFLIHNYRFPCLWEANPFPNATAYYMCGTGVIMAFFGSVNLMKPTEVRKKVIDYVQVPTKSDRSSSLEPATLQKSTVLYSGQDKANVREIRYSDPSELSSAQVKTNTLQTQNHGKPVICGILPSDQKLDFPLYKRGNLPESHTIFLFQRWDDRIADLSYVKEHLNALKQETECTNLIYIIYSKDTDPIQLNDFKQKVIEWGFFCIELRIAGGFGSKFKATLNDALQKWHNISINQREKLQQILDETPTTAFLEKVK